MINVCCDCRFFFIYTYFLVLYHLQLNIFASFVCRNGQNGHIIPLSFLLRCTYQSFQIVFRYITCNGIRVFRDLRYSYFFFNDIFTIVRSDRDEEHNNFGILIKYNCSFYDSFRNFYFNNFLI